MTRLLTTCAAIIGLSCLATASQAQNADQFGQALDQMGIGEPVMTYTCRLSGNEVLGLPVIIGREQFRTVSISIGEEAAASVNGTVIEPVHIKHADNGEDISGVIYDAREFQKAMSGNVSSEMFGLSGEDKQAFERLKSMMQGSVDQTMGDRRRFVSILLKQDAIGFFDLDANDQATNRTMGDCARGM